MAPSIIRPVSPNSFWASKSKCSGGVINPSFILFHALMSFLSIIDLFSALYNAAGGSSYRSCVSRLFPADRQHCRSGGFFLVLCGRSRIITSNNLNLVRHYKMINSEKLQKILSRVGIGSRRAMEQSVLTEKSPNSEIVQLPLMLSDLTDGWWITETL